MSGPENENTVVRARQRKANAALQLKVAGADWEEIAGALGYPTERAAQVAVESALERELRTEGSQARMRHLASKRLERLLRSTWPKAIDEENPEHLIAVGKAREVMADWRKLHGLDAPTQMVVHSPTEDQIEQWVAAVISQQPGAIKLEEDDIFEVETVEDEPKELETSGHHD